MSRPTGGAGSRGLLMPAPLPSALKPALAWGHPKQEVATILLNPSKGPKGRRSRRGSCPFKEKAREGRENFWLSDSASVFLQQEDPSLPRSWLSCSLGAHFPFDLYQYLFLLGID